MNILSLFDGISCGQIALNRIGIKYDKYFSSEIDKYAIKITQANYPNTIQLGDVTQINVQNLPTIDILLAGSPCQGFSRAGNGLNFYDDRSKLFFEFVKILNEIKPKYFLLENVKMKYEHQNLITKYLHVEPIAINSSLVSAQNRDRLYWTNIPNVSMPIDKNIILKDVIQENYDGIWVWPRGGNNGGVKHYNNKSPSITTSSWQHNFLIYKKNVQIQQGNNLKQEGYINSDSQGNRIYNICGKSPTINASSGGIAGNGNALILTTGLGFRGRKENGKWYQIPTLNKEQKSNTITAQFRGKTDFVWTNGAVRKFTPIEVERLQTIPDNYTNYVSDNQRYKCLGNAWTVDVICHILQNIK